MGLWVHTDSRADREAETMVMAESELLLRNAMHHPTKHRCSSFLAWTQGKARDDRELIF
jgi:hypothetical protein